MLHHVNDQDFSTPTAPFSQMVLDENYAFLSGIVASDIPGGEEAIGDIAAETRVVMKSILKLLALAGLDMEDVVRSALDLKMLRKSVDAYMPTLVKLYRERAGVELIGIWPLAAQVIWCAVPISGLADMQGKKTRVSGAASAEFMEAIGAVPTTISFPEVVPSLQRKVIDCAVTGTVAGNVAKWTEVTTHLYPLVLGWGLEGVYVNKKWWDGLNPKARTFLQARTDELVELGWQQADVGTNNGIWCTTGDSRCDPDVVVPIPLDRLNHILVPVTETAKKKTLELVEKIALPKFAARCGKACIDNWNKTVGKVFGVTARMP